MKKTNTGANRPKGTGVCAICGKPYCTGEEVNGTSFGEKHFGCNSDPLFPNAPKMLEVCEDCDRAFVQPVRIVKMQRALTREDLEALTDLCIEAAATGDNCLLAEHLKMLLHSRAPGRFPPKDRGLVWTAEKASAYVESVILGKAKAKFSLWRVA